MDAGDILLSLLYAFGTTIALLWLLIKVRPKFPSMLSTTLVVFFGFMMILFIDTILEFAIAPLTGSRVISIGYGFEISILEETMKILVAALGIFIAKEETKWTDIKLLLAFLSGLTFGVLEGLIYVANVSYSAFGLLNLFLSRMVHPVMTVTLMAGLILLTKGRKIARALIAVSPYVTHALLDHYISMKSYYIASAVPFVALVAFVAGIYFLMPTIAEEKKTRSKFEREATVSIEDHWLRKM